MPRRLIPPLRGVGNNTAKVDTPAEFCPPDNMRNVRVFGSQPGERPRMGPRPGVVKAFAAQMGAGARVQAMKVVGRASGVSGYEPGDVTAVDGGSSRTAGTLAGQCWVLDAQHGMYADFLSTANESAFSLGWHPTAKRIAYQTLVSSGGTIVSRVRYVDADPDSATFGTVLWTTDVSDRDPGGSLGTFPIFANATVVTASFVYVCAGPWLFVLRTSNGTYLKRYTMSGWAEEVMHAALRTDGRLAVAFRGSNSVSGPVTTSHADTGNGNGEASHFRSGVMLFDVTATAPASLNPGDDVLTAVQFGTKKTALYAWYEDHLYFRLSEQVAMQPRGRFVNALAATPDGGLVLATCNKGWGPNSTYAPDNTVAARSLVKISSGTSGASLSWEADVQSRLDPRTTTIGGVPTTHYNDIPHPSDAVNNPNDPHPSADAVCVDAAGDIYVAGRTNASGYSVRKCRASDGFVVWEQNCGDWTPQHGIAFDQAQNAVVVCGKRNTTWEDSGGASALLWFLDAETGDIVDEYDLGETVDAWGVACGPDGETAFVTTVVT